ncbi:MAG: agmatine deiminase family protein [Pseudomonadota bacterium]
MHRSPYHPLPEWAPQAAIWAGWPRLPDEWGSAYDGAKDEIEIFLKTLANITPVKIACGSRTAYREAYFRFANTSNISLHTLPSGDIWVRDTGPIFTDNGEGLTAHIFRFNGWGGKYFMSGDDLTAGGIASAELSTHQRHSFIFEGGAIDHDGAGRLLTTRQCLLNPNRNPDWTEAKAETVLQDVFGATDIIWLDQGLLNDHTDGHVDNIARFIASGLVVCQKPSGHDDPNTETLKAVENQLRGSGLDVITLPSPGLIVDGYGAPLPASHMNFLISNGHIILPVYEPEHSVQAIAILEKALPEYKIIGLPARHILSGGGAFHCMTQQVPKV